MMGMGLSNSVHVRRYPDHVITGEFRIIFPKWRRTVGKSPTWGEAPTVQIKTKICMIGSLSDVITCANFHVEFFLGVTSLQVIEFPIFLLTFAWALQQCSAIALPVRLWYILVTTYHDVNTTEDHKKLQVRSHRLVKEDDVRFPDLLSWYPNHFNVSVVYRLPMQLIVAPQLWQMTDTTCSQHDVLCCKITYRLWAQGGYAPVLSKKSIMA